MIGLSVIHVAFSNTLSATFNLPQLRSLSAGIKWRMFNVYEVRGSPACSEIWSSGCWTARCVRVHVCVCVCVCVCVGAWEMVVVVTRLCSGESRSLRHYNPSSAGKGDEKKHITATFSWFFNASVRGFRLLPWDILQLKCYITRDT